MIGYSFGGVVCFHCGIELQKQLKPQSLSKLILLDSSPVMLKLSTDEAVKFHNIMEEENGYIEGLLSFLMQYTTIDYQQMKTILLNTPKQEREAKVSQIFNEITGISYALKTIEFAAESYFNKLYMMNKYCPTDMNKFIGDILLFKATEHIININDCNGNNLMSNDYGLSEV
jgi:thioesterase domain-containing protein